MYEAHLTQLLVLRWLDTSERENFREHISISQQRAEVTRLLQKSIALRLVSLSLFNERRDGGRCDRIKESRVKEVRV